MQRFNRLFVAILAQGLFLTSNLFGITASKQGTEEMTAPSSTRQPVSFAYIDLGGWDEVDSCCGPPVWE